MPNLRIRDFARIQRRSINPANHQKETFFHFSIPAFDAYFGPIIERGAEIESNKFFLDEKGILVSKLNPRKPRVIKFDPMRFGQHKSICSTEFICLLIDENRIDFSFAYHFFSSKSFNDKMDRIATGTTNSHVRTKPEAILDWRYDFPGLAEQKRIAEILDEVDRQIGLLELEVSKLLVVWTAVSQNQNGEKANNQQKDKIRFGEVVSVVGGFAFKSEEFGEDGVPVIRISDIFEDTVSIADAVRVSERALDDKYIVKQNDILMALSGATTGKSGEYRELFPSYLNQRVGKFVIKDDTKIQKDFVKHLVKTDYFKSRILVDAIGGAQPNVSPKQIEATDVSIPEFKTQNNISNLLSIIDLRVAQIRFEKERLLGLKSGLVLQLIGGTDAGSQ